jgi:tetratricopeptide (TPR) repeat protein
MKRQAKDSWELKEDEKVTEATVRKEHGNKKFNQKRWEAAIKRYKNAVQLIEHDKGFTEENKAAAAGIKRSANLNLAAAYLQLGQLKDAIAACNKVLSPGSLPFLPLVFRTIKVEDSSGAIHGCHCSQHCSLTSRPYPHSTPRCTFYINSLQEFP